MTDLIAALAKLDAEVRFDTITRALYSTDASVYQIEPLGVVIPRSSDAVIAAVHLAALDQITHELLPALDGLEAAFAAKAKEFKNIVKAGLARECEVQLSYAIGYPDPVSVYVNTFGTAKEGLTDEAITNAVEKVFSFKPADIVKQLNLLRPIYGKTTNYGHFGKSDKDLTWEATNKVEALLKAI